MVEEQPPGNTEDDGETRASQEDAELQEMLLNNVGVTTFLQELATLAASTLSTRAGTLHCGVTVARHRKPTAAASSDDLARSLDELQNGFDDGPCLAAMRRHEMVLVQDVSLELRWPGYTGLAAARGIGLILALPLDLNGEAEGVVNLYAEKPGGFAPSDIATARNFVANASKSLQLALSRATLRGTSDDLAAAMKSRAMIDMAVGVIMVQNRCTHEEALHQLARSSSARNTRLGDTAAEVVGALNGRGPAGAREHTWPDLAE